MTRGNVVGVGFYNQKPSRKSNENKVDIVTTRCSVNVLRFVISRASHKTESMENLNIYWCMLKADWKGACRSGPYLKRKFIPPLKFLNFRIVKKKLNSGIFVLMCFIQISLPSILSCAVEALVSERIFEELPKKKYVSYVLYLISLSL